MQVNLVTVLLFPQLIFIDFEKGISNVTKKFSIYKYQIMCLALKSSLEIQKNRLCSNEFDNNNNLYTYYN